MKNLLLFLFLCYSASAQIVYYPVATNIATTPATWQTNSYWSPGAVCIPGASSNTFSPHMLIHPAFAVIEQTNTPGGSLAIVYHAPWPAGYATPVHDTSSYVITMVSTNTTPFSTNYIPSPITVGTNTPAPFAINTNITHALMTVVSTNLPFPVTLQSFNPAQTVYQMSNMQ